VRQEGIRVWAHAQGVGQRLRKQLRKTNRRAGEEVMSLAEIKKVTSKIMRRRMATKLARTLGIDAAVKMG
jgi:L-alanine-DL-glutamate epimerase-like enolase superfamily enzyme